MKLREKLDLYWEVQLALATLNNEAGEYSPERVEIKRALVHLKAGRVELVKAAGQRDEILLTRRAGAWWAKFPDESAPIETAFTDKASAAEVVRVIAARNPLHVVRASEI